ncbi:very long chain fatty acid elongase 4-like isoform X2 [Parasteatoda tepidariorum]|uniref:very long chain fatty acid elongase 4-like isoform X2 n=1 Tax=Parasteatoda tepidariorum TaxID=114398 RepID=UPI0039BC324C
MIQKMFLTDIYNFFKADGDIYETKALARNPKITVFIAFTYILLTKWLIPWILEKRKPLEIKRTILIYNFLVGLLNGILACMAIIATAENWKNRCTVETIPKQQIHVFFALRKKKNQLTFLHVFHHSANVLLFGFGFYIRTTDFVCLFGTAINTSIHVVMYSYYALASIGPHMQKYLWWKKYLTLLQIIQFVVILSYSLYGFVTGCENFGRFKITFYIFVTLILVLFINFYTKSYHAKNTPSNYKVY